MKTFFIVLLLMSMPSFAVNKCVVDGKTIYQQSPCPGETQVEMSSKGVSSIGSESIREEVVTKGEQRKQAYIEQLKAESKIRPTIHDELDDWPAIKARAETAKEKLRELGLRTKEDDIMDKIDEAKRAANRAAANALIIRR